MAKRRPSKVIVRQAIMKHAGLSGFDLEEVDKEVDAIYSALYRNGYRVVKNGEDE